MISPTTYRRVLYSVLGICLAIYACTADAAETSEKTNEVKVNDITLKVPADWKNAPPSNTSVSPVLVGGSPRDVTGGQTDAKKCGWAPCNIFH